MDNNFKLKTRLRVMLGLPEFIRPEELAQQPADHPILVLYSRAVEAGITPELAYDWLEKRYSETHAGMPVVLEDFPLKEEDLKRIEYCIEFGHLSRHDSRFVAHGLWSKRYDCADEAMQKLGVIQMHDRVEPSRFIAQVEASLSEQIANYRKTRGLLITAMIRELMWAGKGKMSPIEAKAAAIQYLNL